jgi:hypothetical protein
MWRLTNPARRMPRTFPVSTSRTNVADHAAALGVTGSLIKPSFRVSRRFVAYRAFERVLIGSVPRTR